MTVPILTLHGEVIGVIQVSAKRRARKQPARTFPDDLRKLESVARLIGKSQPKGKSIAHSAG